MTQYLTWMISPLVVRELIRASRREGTYAARAAAPGLALVIMVPPYLSMKLFDATVSADSIADYLFGLVTICQGGIVYFLTPWIASSAIADESGDATLDLMNLADRSHTEFYLGKLVSVWLQAVALLLGLVPLQVLAAFLGSSSADPILPALFHYTAVSASVCAVGLFFSALFKRAGFAFIATLLCMLLWTFSPSFYHLVVPEQLASPWLHSLFLFAKNSLAVVAPVVAAVATLRLLGHPEFDIFRLGRGQARRRKRSPKSAAGCIARIVAIEGHGIATFAQAWWGRLIAATLLALIAVWIRFPTALLFGVAVGAEAFVVGRNLQRTRIFDDLSMTTAGSRAVAKGIIRGQFQQSLVFAPAIFLSLNLNSIYGAWSRFSLRVEQFLRLDSTIILALGPVLVIGYGLVLIYFFTAVGIHYASEGCSPGRMALNLLALFLVIAMLISMVSTGYYLIFETAIRLGATASTGTQPVLPPPPMMGTGPGDVVAGLVILPWLILEYRKRIVRRLDYPPPAPS